MFAIRTVCFCVAVGAWAAPAHATEFKTLYEALAERGEYDPKADSFAPGRTAKAELDKVAWLEGAWRQVARIFPNGAVPGSKADAGIWVFTLDRDANAIRWAPREVKGETLTFMTFDPYARVWFGVESSYDTWGAVRSGADWSGTKIVVEGRVTIRGVACDLRQTFERIKPGEFVVLNEQRRPDGTWVAVDEHRFFREAGK